MTTRYAVTAKDGDAFYSTVSNNILETEMHRYIDSDYLSTCYVTSECTENGWRYTAHPIERVAAPLITPAQRVEIAVRSALLVDPRQVFTAWASDWLNGSDRTDKSAYAAGKKLMRVDPRISTDEASARKHAQCCAAMSASWLGRATDENLGEKDRAYAVRMVGEWASDSMCGVRDAFRPKKFDLLSIIKKVMEAQ